MDAPTNSYATAGIALRVSGALKPHHHDKVETPSVGTEMNYFCGMFDRKKYFMGYTIFSLELDRKCTRYCIQNTEKQ
jgi:hypothetical protein